MGTAQQNLMSQDYEADTQGVIDRSSFPAWTQSCSL